MRTIIKWLRQLKEWLEKFADKPGAMYTLFLIAFAESSFFPIPPDILLIAIAISQPKKAFTAALWCTLGSVFGGIFGYWIGYALMGAVGNSIVEFYNLQEVWKIVVDTYQSEVGYWFLAGAAFSPIPYKISTIAAGATEMSLMPFIIISSLGRAGRFFLVGSLIYFIGPKVKYYIDKYFDKLSLAFVVLLILGFVAIRYLF